MCVMVVCWILGAKKRAEFPVMETLKEGEMLLLMCRGNTHLSAPLWLTTQNVFFYKMSVCACEDERVCVLKE